MPYSILTDQDANFAAMRRYQNQREEKKHTTVQCTNCGARIEVARPEDQYLKCLKCHKKFFLSYSIANSKLYTE
jgi:ribosomal protein L37AE/L43A